MEYRFKAEIWEKLSKDEQIKRCTAMANEATALAHAAPPNMKEACLPLTVRFEWPLGGQEGQAATYECAESGLEAAKFEAAILYASASFGPRAPTASAIIFTPTATAPPFGALVLVVRTP